MNRISIASSDAGAQALVQTAMDQGHRAVMEQVGVGAQSNAVARLEVDRRR